MGQDTEYRRVTWTAEDAISITPSDSAELTKIPRALYVGGAGAIAVVTALGTAITLSGAVAGSIIPLKVKQVKNTGTTATGLIGLL